MNRTVVHLGLATAVTLSGVLIAGGNASAKDKATPSPSPSPSPAPPPTEDGCRDIVDGFANYPALVEAVSVRNNDDIIIEHTHEIEYTYQARGLVDTAVTVEASSCSTVEYTAILYRIDTTAEGKTYTEYQRVSAPGDGSSASVRLPAAAVDGQTCVGVRLLTTEQGVHVDYAPDLVEAPQERCGGGGPAGTGWS